ncbi:putative thioesterase [Desulfocapsa sulfexigens DSM 10523]|uniref:Putative thioesterase n=1 Tax=Desulfocapsa sulfexigens (strain DSM 10523 / SB164P1) TaxID=1167006 RepID=M1PM55_DESSD|nr:acyl-CoA thioesterase [Desulfocapsa sulfexigens]AGF77511.1 putative thioesterase [Desulfocapsa sulfexigens DSM 10523]
MKYNYRKKMYSIFETDITVRPDDIDMNNHVHYSRYLDYILMARYDQMKKDYKVAMEEFVARGFSWVATEVNIQYKRPILLQDGVVKVRTQLEEFHGARVMINFWIVKGEREKVAAQGNVSFTMITVKSGRPTRVPDDIAAQYQI